MDTSEAIFAFLSRFYAKSEFEDYCRLFEEFHERLWRGRENLAIFALILGQKLPVWPPAGSQTTVVFGWGGSPPPRIFSGVGQVSSPPPLPRNLGWAMKHCFACYPIGRMLEKHSFHHCVAGPVRKFVNGSNMKRVTIA